MDLFTAVKEIRTRDAAELYGFHPDKSGMILCLFHQERTPSMWLNDGFFCHGCHAKGDTIAFVAQAFNLTPKAAAQKLAQDFGIKYDGRITADEIRIKGETASLRKQYEDTAHAFNMTVAACCRKLRKWKKDLAPKAQNEAPDDRFILALRYLPELEFILDEFQKGDLKSRLDIILNFGKRVMEIAGR